MNPVYCRDCHEAVDLADSFCKKCGADQRQPAQQPTVQMNNQSLPAKKSGYKPSSLIMFAVLLIGVCIVGFSFLPKKNDTSPAIVPPFATAEQPVLTVKQVRSGVLKYNGQHVKIRAAIVDRSSDGRTQTPYLVIGDSSKEYMDSINFFRASAVLGKKDDITMRVIPRPTGIEVYDVVILEGVYDGVQNVLNITKVDKIGKEDARSTGGQS